MTFSQSAILFSILLWNGFLLFYFITVRRPRISRELPRNRLFGTPLALFCLVWVSIHLSLFFEEGIADYQFWLWFLPPVGIIFAYFFLSYLFTRALGGLLLLWVIWMLHAAFVVYLPARPLFSLLAYAIAAAGALLIAMPWCFRDLLEKASESPRFRESVSFLLAGSAVVFLVFAIAGRG